MAKKTKKTTTVSVAKPTAKSTRTKVRKSRKKLFKIKKGKDMVKGVVSVVANAGIQKAMDAVFEGRIKKDDFKKKNSEGTLVHDANGNIVIDTKAYKEAVEKQKTLRGGANIGLWLIGAGNVLPKDYVSAEYLEINALEHGINTFLSKSKKESIRKVAPNFQGIEDTDVEGSDEEVNAMIESANMIESALNDDNDVVIEAEEEIAYLEEARKQDDEKVIYNIEGMEGMNQVVPGIEEESY